VLFRESVQTGSEKCKGCQIESADLYRLSTGRTMPDWSEAGMEWMALVLASGQERQAVNSNG
jgi:hypothetical protein